MAAGAPIRNEADTLRRDRAPGRELEIATRRLHDEPAIDAARLDSIGDGVELHRAGRRKIERSASLPCRSASEQLTVELRAAFRSVDAEGAGVTAPFGPGEIQPGRC